MRSIILILICIITLYLIYASLPRYERREFKQPKPIIKRNNSSYYVLSLSDDGVARFLEIPKNEIDDVKPVTYDNYIYYFRTNGVFKNSMGDESVSVRLKDDSKETDFVRKIRYNKYPVVHSELNFTYNSSTDAFNRNDYDLVVRTAH